MRAEGQKWSSPSQSLSLIHLVTFLCPAVHLAPMVTLVLKAETPAQLGDTGSVTASPLPLTLDIRSHLVAVPDVIHMYVQPFPGFQVSGRQAQMDIEQVTV